MICLLAKREAIGKRFFVGSFIRVLPSLEEIECELSILADFLNLSYYVIKISVKI